MMFMCSFFGQIKVLYVCTCVKQNCDEQRAYNHVKSLMLVRISPGEW